jgi:hypothetical protein
MYELGYAIASGKPVVIICSIQKPGTFPFDIQHRGIIQYALESASDFEKLKIEITNKIKALLKKQATSEEIASASPLRSTHGLLPHEAAALVFILANADTPRSGVSTYTIKQDMGKAGYMRSATQLGLIRLDRMGFVEAFEDSNYNGEPFMAYRLAPAGEDWLLDNQDKIQLRTGDDRSMEEVAFDPGISDDDVPF